MNLGAYSDLGNFSQRTGCLIEHHRCLSSNLQYPSPKALPEITTKNYIITSWVSTVDFVFQCQMKCLRIIFLTFWPCLLQTFKFDTIVFTSFHYFFIFSRIPTLTFQKHSQRKLYRIANKCTNTFFNTLCLNFDTYIVLTNIVWS